MLGCDGCRAGWIGIAVASGQVAAYVSGEIGALVAAAEQDGPVDVVAVDIPIGLPDSGRRRADELARARAGPRWASVFITPVRAAVERAVEAADYEAANAENRRRAGEGISRQAYALSEKISQADRWVRRTRHKVVEVHPELSFAEMAGGPLAHGKATWAGAALRRRALAAAGIVVPDDLGAAGGQAGVDDVLDAAAAAWTARRVSEGIARSLPGAPERFSDGIDCAIWI